MTEQRSAKARLEPAGAAHRASTVFHAEPVKPSPVGSLKAVFEHYPDLGYTLPAMGYTEAQMEDLRATVEKFRDEEIEHRDEALAAGAEQAVGYEALSAVIKTGSRLAIWLSTRI